MKGWWLSNAEVRPAQKSSPTRFCREPGCFPPGHVRCHHPIAKDFSASPNAGLLRQIVRTACRL